MQWRLAALQSKLETLSASTDAALLSATDKFEKRILAMEAEHEEELNAARTALVRERELRVKLEEDMRQAFMRGGAWTAKHRKELNPPTPTHQHTQRINTPHPTPHTPHPTPHTPHPTPHAPTPNKVFRRRVLLWMSSVHVFRRFLLRVSAVCALNLEAIGVFKQGVPHPMFNPNLPADISGHVAGLATTKEGSPAKGGAPSVPAGPAPGMEEVARRVQAALDQAAASRMSVAKS